jgi:hypothetical protein
VRKNSIIMLAGQEFITAEQLMAELNVGRNSITLLVQRGIPHSKLGRRRVFNRDEVAAWCRELVEKERLQ